MKFAVWIEGYRGHVAQGERATAEYLGEHEGETFIEACRAALLARNWDMVRHYDPARNTYWGMRFFDNEADARKAHD